MTKTLTVNWHILEACNYSCKYCYAKYRGRDPSKELWKRPKDWKPVLDQFKKLPQLVEGEFDNNIRLNIAGGEPMLLWHNGPRMLQEVLEYATDLGFEISIISNGALIDDLFIERWGPKLKIVGISLDTFSKETNLLIGRCDNKGGWTSPDDVAKLFAEFRKVNPSIECKLNTVVNAFNYKEDLNDTIKMIGPDRWKVFQMLPVADTEKQEKLQAPLIIDREQFMEFVSRHNSLSGIMKPEDNDDMTDSYIMMDPMGRLYQNDGTEGSQEHIFSDPLFIIAIEKALKQVKFDSRKYKDRYSGKCDADVLAVIKARC